MTDRTDMRAAWRELTRPFRFRYDIRSVTVGGCVWYCQKPGKQWRTDPRKFPSWQFTMRYVVSYDRMYDDFEQGWYLFGTAVHWKGEYVGKTLAEAMTMAALYLPTDMRDP